jgi:hypothetical protein
MKQKPDVLEHGWTRRAGTQIAARLTAAQAKEQAEYDKAVGCALKAMGYRPRRMWAAGNLGLICFERCL